jgi:hypothetical protein
MTHHDLRYDRTLPRALRAAGLVDVTPAGYFPVGGVACDRLETATVHMVSAELRPRGWPTTSRSTRTWPPSMPESSTSPSRR